jgi:hypothetical protein
MQVFRDNQGRIWTVAIDVAAVRRVRGVVGVDLFEAIHSNLLSRFGSDLALLTNVLYAVCLPQADLRGMTDEDFGAALTGKGILLAAAEALDGDILAFFPSPRPGAPKPKINRPVPTSAEIWEMIYQAAGKVGVDPGPLTLRELLEMAEARGAEEWRRTSSLLAMLFNAHRDPRRSNPAMPDDYNPHARRNEDQAQLLKIPSKMANKLMFEAIGGGKKKRRA